MSTFAECCPHCQSKPDYDFVDTESENKTEVEAASTTKKEPQEVAGVLKAQRHHSDDLVYAKVTIWGKTKDGDSWNRYGCLEQGGNCEIELAPGLYTFRACVGAFFDENSDHEQCDDFEELDVEIESHRLVALDVRTWGDLYIDLKIQVE